MSTYTKNLNLFKYDVTADEKVPFSITDALNNNWDIIDSKCGSSNNLLDFKWSDHLLNDMSWLRADTFSWQDGNTYSLVYNELLTEYNNSASTTATDGSITFKRTPKGYKIALANQETAIAEKYTTDGIAWYYILDTANKKFKLPRTKYGFVGLRDSVGDYIPESLPNIKGKVGYIARTTNDSTIGQSGAFYDGGAGSGLVGSGSASRSNLGFNASLFSSTYQDNAPVQQRATQMYLYFYVGEFTQTAIEQTAGLNAGLFDEKVDKSDLAEIYPVVKTYVNGTSGYRIWSDGYCEQWGEIPASSTSTTLLKSFIDINYNIFMCGSDYGDHDQVLGSTSRTVNSFVYLKSSRKRFWQASGYLAEG